MNKETSRPYTREELLQRVEDLEKELRRQKRSERINRAIFRISNAIGTAETLDDLFEAIHRSLGTVMDTANFYIALYDPSTDRITFPYCVDEVDQCYPEALAVSKSASLTAEVIRTGNPLLIPREAIFALQSKSGLVAPSCTPSAIWLGAPLKTPEGIIGVMATQSYTDPDLYDQTDLAVMGCVAEQAAIAIERKRAEEALKASEERFRGLADATFEAVFISEKGRCIDTNRAATTMFGYTYDEFIGIMGTDVIAPESKETVLNNILSGYEEPYEVMAEKKDGTLFHVEIRGRMIDFKGRSVRVTVVNDIDARKRADEEREKLIKELQKALKEIKTLRGILPICSNCKKIRDDKGYWNRIEAYIFEHSEAEFSHSICPDCADVLYPDLDLYGDI